MTIARYAGRIALVSALLAAPAAAQNYAVLSTNLFGENVPGGGAGSDAAADFDGEIDLMQNRLCYFLEVEGLADANAAHVHHAQGGASGPVVATIPLPDTSADEICVPLEAPLLRAFADKPGEYYLDIHSVGKPEGALRGQFGD